MAPMNHHCRLWALALLLAVSLSSFGSLEAFCTTPSSSALRRSHLQEEGSLRVEHAAARGHTRSDGSMGHGSNFAGASRIGGWAPLARSCAILALAAVAGTALIVQNKGGGHGEIGYHLALNLARERGLQVTMINDSAAKQASPPFSSYNDLAAAGVKVIWADLGNGGLAGALGQVQPCEYVFDNQNVCPKDVQQVVAAWNPKVYAYVSSGGMYVPVEGPLWEGGAVKEDNKQLSIERNAASKGLPWCSFRPQYIYGDKTNKRDYLDWFLDRICAGVEFPLPGNGSFRTTVTNAEDVAGMMASVVNKPEAAVGQVFNCANDQLISHIEIVEQIAMAVGKNPTEVKQKIIFYDPASLKGKELPKKGKFPFRENTFGVAVEKAKGAFAWAPKHYLLGDIKAYYEVYKQLGKQQQPLVNEWDVAVINIAKGRV